MKMKEDPLKIQKFFEEYINICLQNDALQNLDALIVKNLFKKINLVIYF